MEDRVRALFAELNSLSIGDVDGMMKKLDATRAALARMGQEDLAAKVGEARDGLARGDVAAFRKSVLQVLSKLGHVRA